MLTPEQVEGLGLAFERLADPMVEFLIKDIARRVRGAGQLTSTAAYQIMRAQAMGVDRNEIKARVSKELGKQMSQVEHLFIQAAEVGYNFDISHLPGDAVPFHENTSVQQITRAAVDMAGEELKNLTRTIGFVGPDGTARKLTEAYQNAADYAFAQTFSGSADLNTAVRNACKGLVKNGIVVVEYESGVHTSIEAAIRRNMMGGLGLMVEKISQYNHDAFGADGWEISAHYASAPDHAPIQGRQYTDEAFTKLNGSLRRRIGTLNCGHNAFPIILGVSSPQYSRAELDRMRRENEKGVDYEGRHFATVYDATQYQRRIERAIRAQKRRILVEEAAKDENDLLTAQIKYARLNQEYKRFSNATGLRTQRERLEVSGFGRAKAIKALEEKKRIEKLANMMYDIGTTEENVDAWFRDKPIREKLKSGDIPADILKGQQNKHIQGTNEYKQYVAKLKKEQRFGPSYLTITISEAQELVDRYRGTGILPRKKDGKWKKQELITIHTNEVGIVVNDRTGQAVETTTFKIHYGEKGTHIVPDYPSKKGAKGKK